MKEIACPNCPSDEIVANVTNFADVYYCWNCDTPFNPAKWPCPWCDTDEPVNRNPFDDPAEYYCYECDLAFNRMGASFAPSEIEYGSLEEGFEMSTKRLSLDVEEMTEIPPRVFNFTLQNSGEVPVLVEGQLPIAVQSQITDDDWWTIHGNPRGFTPDERVELAPNETIEWELLLFRNGIRGPGFELNQRFPGGKYRIVYWGIPRASSALSVRLDLKLE